MQKSPYEVLLNYSFWLLGRKNYSEAELRQRLGKRGKKLKLADLEPAAEKVIERLKELHYVDDEKIIENYFEYRLKSRPKGKFLFLHEMHRRGISLETAKREWERRGVSEKELAVGLLDQKKQKFAGMPVVLQKKKIAAFLAGRGFSPETVWGMIDKI